MWPNFLSFLLATRSSSRSQKAAQAAASRKTPSKSLQLASVFCFNSGLPTCASFLLTPLRPRSISGSRFAADVHLALAKLCVAPTEVGRRKVGCAAVLRATRLDSLAAEARAADSLLFERRFARRRLTCCGIHYRMCFSVAGADLQRGEWLKAKPC